MTARAVALTLILALAACDGEPKGAANITSGAVLERAAVRTGLVIDPTSIDLVGAWARDTDHVCVVPADAGTYRIGALIDYGRGQGCAASGTATRNADRVAIRFGRCSFEARLDGSRLEFPAAVPESCAVYCVGRASFAALSVDQLSTSTSEASTLRAPDRKPLCAS